MTEHRRAPAVRMTLPFLLVMVLFLTVCITLVVYYNYRNSDRLVEAEISRTFISIIEEKNRRLGEVIGRELALFDSLLRHENVELLLTQPADAYTKAMRILDWRAHVVEQTARSYIYSIYIRGQGGVRFYYNDIIFPLQPPHEETQWYARASNLEYAVHWFGVVGSELYGGEPFLYGARKVYSPGGASTAAAGIAYVTLNRGVVSGVAADLESDGDVYVVDSTQRVLYATDATLVGKQLDSLDIGADVRDRASYAIRRERRSARMVVVSSSNSMGWRLVHERPYLPLMSRFRQNKFLLYSIVVWVAAAMLVFVIVLRTRVSMPLVRLHEKMVGFMGPGTVEAEAPGRPNIQALDRDVARIMRSARRMQRRSAEAEARSRIEELRRIQAQISPHFLWRVLNNVRFLVMMGERDRVVRVLDELFGLLKSSLDQEGEMVSLGKEVENLRRYVAIMDAIYEGAIEFKLDLDATLDDQRLPIFTLQPIVENSIYHGIDPSTPGSRISVASRSENGVVWLEVQDNGVGMDEETKRRVLAGTQDERMGLGLASVDRKLKLHYGEEFGIRIQSSPQGTRVSMLIPRQTE